MSAFQYAAWRMIRLVVQWLPPGAAYLAAAALGNAAFFTWRRGRRVTIKNYRVVLGPGASKRRVERTARTSMVNYCRYLVDFARLPADEAGTQAELVENRRVLDQLANESGVVVAAMHFGNWDVGALAAAGRGLPITAIAESFGHPKLDAEVFGARERAGMEIVPMEQSRLRPLRALKEGRHLLLLVDRPLRSGGARVKFFGRHTHVPDGAARLALAANVPVVPAACYRLHRKQPGWRLTLGDAILPPETRDRAAASHEIMQAVFRAHERIIEQHPAQWYMFRDMWPDDAAGQH